MAGHSWTHRLARPLVRPLVGTGITPNDITTARLVTGLMAVAALCPGTPGWNWWAGGLWLLSAFLDRADGELARLGNMTSPEGQAWDFRADLIVNPSFFVGIGIGLRHSALGQYAIPMGIISGASVFLAAFWSEALVQRQGGEAKAYSGAFGFDFDDLLYLLAPMVWLGWAAPILLGTVIGGTLMAMLTAWRLYRLPLRPSSGSEERA